MLLKHLFFTSDFFLETLHSEITLRSVVSIDYLVVVHDIADFLVPSEFLFAVLRCIVKCGFVHVVQHPDIRSVLIVKRCILCMRHLCVLLVNVELSLCNLSIIE